MKLNKKSKLLTVFLLVMLLTTGCTKTLENKDGKAVTNPVTGQSLTENILCQPTDEETIKIYNEHLEKVKLEKLPECDKYEFNSGKDEGLWTNVFVKPLALFILTIGNLVGNFGLALIIASLAIRAVSIPITRKTAIQSELLAKAKPELDRNEKKFEGKNDNESMFKKSQEISMIYKKYNISPMSGCLYAFLQLPIFIAFLEAINRTPAIFEGKFLGLQLGTTPSFALSHGNFGYIILPILVFIVTFFSLKLNGTQATDDSNPAAGSTKMMMNVMIVMITISAFQL